MKSSSICLLLAVSSYACRPMGDLDAARQGSAGVSASSESGSSEVPVPFTPSVVTMPASSDSAAEFSSGSLAPAPSSAPVTNVSGSLSDLATTASVDEQSTGGTPTSLAFSDTSSGLVGSGSEQSTPNTSTAPSETTEQPPSCSSKCALGSVCEEFTDCLSLRCDGVCEPMELVVESDGLDAISTSIKMHVELYADPSVAVAWQDLAVLYFVTVEKHDDFKLNFAQGGGTAIPMQITLKDWILVWTTDATGNVPTTVTPFDVQIHSYPWLPDVAESNDNSNDFSYRAEPGPNDKIVLCRRVEGEWRHAQGTAPSTIPNPCQYVGNCDAALSCDPLEASPP